MLLFFHVLRCQGSPPLMSLPLVFPGVYNRVLGHQSMYLLNWKVLLCFNYVRFTLNPVRGCGPSHCLWPSPGPHLTHCRPHMEGGPGSTGRWRALRLYLSTRWVLPLPSWVPWGKLLDLFGLSVLRHGWWRTVICILCYSLCCLVS